MSGFYSDQFRQVTDSLDSFISIKNKELQYIYANRASLNYLGFRSLNQLTELAPTDYEIRCPAQQCAATFVAEDQQVQLHIQPIQALALCLDSKGSRVLMLGTKQPWHDENGTVGVICNYQPIYHAGIINFAEVLQNLDAHYSTNKQFSYEILSAEKESDLPIRQAECLFYLLRGFSAKMIAKKLKLSPRTVEIHIRNLKEKYNCNSKSQLIDYAIACGLQSYVPKSILEDFYI